jgi:hypothetical protein
VYEFSQLLSIHVHTHSLKELSNLIGGQLTRTISVKVFKQLLELHVSLFLFRVHGHELRHAAFRRVFRR